VSFREAVLAAVALERPEPLEGVEVVLAEEVDPQSRAC
jgi:hypothetical protein